MLSRDKPYSFARISTDFVKGISSVFMRPISSITSALLNRASSAPFSCDFFLRPRSEEHTSELQSRFDLVYLSLSLNSLPTRRSSDLFSALCFTDFHGLNAFQRQAVLFRPYQHRFCKRNIQCFHASNQLNHFRFAEPGFIRPFFLRLLFTP